MNRLLAVAWSYLVFQAKYFRTNIKTDLYSFACKDTCIGDYSNISSVRLSRSAIGKFTYFGKSKYTLCKLKCGSFSSIGIDFVILNGAHPTKTFVSTSPVFYSKHPPLTCSLVEEDRFQEKKLTRNGYYCEIGNDVWIGFGVRAMGGVTIGDGAIVGAGSIVTKDIPAYEIWAGVPAKKIGVRFNEKDLRFVKDSEWWSNDVNWLKDNAQCFESIAMFRKANL